MKKLKKVAMLLCTALCVGATTAALAACEIGNPYGTKPEAGASLKGEEVFVYDENGVRVEQNEVMVEIGGYKYYVVANKIVKNTYRVVDGRVYYFGADGKIGNGAAGDDYTFGEEGYIVGDYFEMQIGGKDYYIIEDSAYAATAVNGVIYESDNDYDMSNNDLLKNVTCSVTIAGQTYTVTTNDYGEFSFSKLPAMVGIVFEFTLDNYISATLTVTSFENGRLVIVLDRNVSNILSGQIVTAAGGAAMEGATVTLKRTTSTNALEFTAVSDENGNYTFEGLTAGVYDLTVEKEGFITISQTVQVHYNETTLQNITLEAISSADVEKTGTASGTIKDALTGNVITVHLTVYIRRGINNFAGESIARVQTDDEGHYVTPTLPVGNYTAYVVDERTLPEDEEDERYRSQTIALKILGDTETVGQDATVSNNKGIAAGTGVRIVLTWGETPSDLDSHLVFGGYHVYFSWKNSGGCSLDVDDRDSYGPETVTIPAVSESYTYHYYVHNYSGTGTFKNANAVVKVYIGAKEYTFYAPAGEGWYWHIFTLNGATGEFVVNNAISSSESYN